MQSKEWQTHVELYVLPSSVQSVQLIARGISGVAERRGTAVQAASLEILPACICIRSGRILCDTTLHL